MLNNHCNRCRWWQRKGQSDVGQCRVASPSPGWPTTAADDFCGEFAPRTKTTTRRRPLLLAAAPDEEEESCQPPSERASLPKCSTDSS